jgi:hypothetical protein
MGPKIIGRIISPESREGRNSVSHGNSKQTARNIEALTLDKGRRK